MPRAKRDDFPGARHHVMNRGVRHGAIFYSDHHCIRFLELLEAAVERFGIRLVAYVLMGNHYHLLLESVRGNLSAAMKMISQEYTQFVNQSPGWEGPVFRGRFKSKLVIDDGHWHHLPMYMHLNPVRARMVTHASQYTWSSQTAYSGETNPPAWLDTGDLMDGYGGPAEYNELLEEVVQGRQPAPEEFSQRARRSVCEGIDTARAGQRRQSRAVPGSLVAGFWS